MLQTRVIPCLLLKDGGLVKTVRFSKPTYVGDPINAVKIFNDKEVDELVLLDITASVRQKPPDFRLLENIANEAFMPLGYGGGVRTEDDVRRILKIGFEKIVLNSVAASDPGFIRRAAAIVGCQSIVISVDVRKKLFGGYEVYTQSGNRGTGQDPVSFARRAQEEGAGELILHSIDRDGTMAGYDVPLLRQVTAAVTIPVVALGGAAGLPDFAEAVKAGGASAVAAGSLFVFHGKHRAVLINYPERAALDSTFAP
jgi:cyclase